MFTTTTSSFRRIAAIAGATTITCITAITTTYAAQPAPAITEPAFTEPATNEPERPCFIIQPRWNTADGPAPTSQTPSWQLADPADARTRNRIDFGDEYAAEAGIFKN